MNYWLVYNDDESWENTNQYTGEIKVVDGYREGMRLPQKDDMFIGISDNHESGVLSYGDITESFNDDDDNKLIKLKALNGNEKLPSYKKIDRYWQKRYKREFPRKADTISMITEEDFMNIMALIDSPSG